MEDFNSEIEECTSSESSDIFNGDDQNYIHNAKRRSFVWRYFNEIPKNPKVFECTVCRAYVGAQTCNLSRHLLTVHNITRNSKAEVDVKRGRPSRSFIWKYCTRENEKQAFCHLCKKLLYFGGGNTSNIAKHLRRIHADIIENNGDYVMDHTSPEIMRATASIVSGVQTNESSEAFKGEEDSKNFSIPLKKKERKGCSYVWKYCEKVSKHSVQCRLCNKIMSFHGTANVITHLQRRHNILGKSDADTSIANTEIITIMQPPTFDEETILNNSHEIDTKNIGNRGQITSIVWKYCQRISKETVRCSFCRKNLSYQGTSNLQRHLHRMHGVIATTRSPIDVPVSASIELIDEHCSSVDEDRIKCNMCNQIFNYENTDTIYKHIVVTHGVCIAPKTESIGHQEGDEILYFDFDVQNDESLIKGEQIIEIAATEDEQSAEDNKRLDMFYEDIIEEDLQEFMPIDDHELEVVEQQKAEESKFSAIMVGEDDLINNPLSPESSEDPPSPPPTTTGEGRECSQRLQELKEERVRMQASYFREKAGYYRMQKYLAALQARKVRAELDQLKNSGQILSENDSTIVEFTN